MQQLWKHLLFCTSLLSFWMLLVPQAQGQYARGNSPYSRYGLGDLKGLQFTPSATMSGGLAATYRSYWDINLVNPASLGKLRYTAFQLGLNYEHHELSERSTGLRAQADNGNLTYISLAFPITKSWEIMQDTLRRGVPVQWGMGFSLSPYSTVNYDVAVTRTIEDIDNVRFNYTGSGDKYRVNWANGVTYKGISAGLNVGLIFGQFSNSTTIDFQSPDYLFAYDQRFVTEENGVGVAWDFGAQYEYVLPSKDGTGNRDANFSNNRKITVGAYIGGVSSIATNETRYFLRERAFTGSIDSVVSIDGVQGLLEMPLKVGGGISYGRDLGFIIGASYESEFWSTFRRNGNADPNLTDAHRVAVGVQWVPDFSDYTSYFTRIRYRFGAHYGLDARTILAADGNRYQLMSYGISAGAGFPMRPPKAKSILGFVNLGLEFGSMGHPELIEDLYFKVNFSFSLNAGGWFNRSKFR